MGYQQIRRHSHYAIGQSVALILHQLNTEYWRNNPIFQQYRPRISHLVHLDSTGIAVVFLRDALSGKHICMRSSAASIFLFLLITNIVGIQNTVYSRDDILEVK